MEHEGPGLRNQTLSSKVLLHAWCRSLSSCLAICRTDLMAGKGAPSNVCMQRALLFLGCLFCLGMAGGCEEAGDVADLRGMKLPVAKPLVILSSIFYNSCQGCA